MNIFIQKMYDIDHISILSPVGFRSLLLISVDSADNFFFFKFLPGHN